MVGLIEGDRSRARATRARKIKRNLDGRYRAWHYRDKGSLGREVNAGDFVMLMFKHERTECQCVDEEANRNFLARPWKPWARLCLPLAG